MVPGIHAIVIFCQGAPKMIKRNPKWDFAIGTLSKVPDSQLHYMMADIDNNSLAPTLRYVAMFATNIITQPTPHGWHVYTNTRMPWHKLMTWLPRVPGIDKRWLAIGRRRGYLFLADKDLVTLNWPVHRMVIHVKKRRTRNSG